GDVEGELDAARARRVRERAHVLDRAELGQHGLVATLCGTDRPRTTDRIGPARLGVVRSLAGRAPDRVDGWQVEDVEAQLGDVVQPVDHVTQGAVARLAVHGRAWKQLVPCTEAGARRIHHDVELAPV